MSKIPRIGNATATEIYIAVGKALSYWEGAEDELLGLYKTLQADRAPHKLASYVAATHKPRAEMMASAIQKRRALFEGDELSRVMKACGSLRDLAARRNEISHGHCTNTNHKIGEEVVMDGHYLVPAWNEWSPIERDLRFALTVAEITEFEEAVRDARSEILTIAWAVKMRQQEIQQAELKARLAREWPLSGDSKGAICPKSSTDAR